MKYKVLLTKTYFAIEIGLDIVQFNIENKYFPTFVFYFTSLRSLFNVGSTLYRGTIKIPPYLSSILNKLGKYDSLSLLHKYLLYQLILDEYERHR